MKKKINFMCTAFRDGFQSAYGARVLTEDFMPAVEAAANAGITHFEAGGGARFQAPFFYCNQLFKKHGMTTIRNFDALNDVNNLIYSGKCIKDAGLRHEVTVTMMSLPPGATGAHDPEFYMNVLKKILDAGIPFDSVCFKDASGTSVPKVVYETIKQARQMLPEGTPIAFHSHETAGVSINQYMAAIEAGATQVDLSLAPVSGGTCNVARPARNRLRFGH